MVILASHSFAVLVAELNHMLKLILTHYFNDFPFIIGNVGIIVRKNKAKFVLELGILRYIKLDLAQKCKRGNAQSRSL